jgi:hypothetical protein
MPQDHDHKTDAEKEAAAKASQAEQILEENKRKNTSGLSWDETTPKPGEKFNRVTDMGEAD